MAAGISLHIGLNRIDPAHYDGWDGALNACEFDANDMQAIAKSAGFQSSVLLNEQVTAEAVTAAIERAAGELGAGDLFLCTYSGHGGQVPDKNGEGEEDRSDETWLTYNRELVDDELYALWAQFAPGVRVHVLSDSCHSGTVTKAIDDDEVVPDVVKDRETAAGQSPRYRAMPKDVMIKTYRAHASLYDGIQEKFTTSDRVDPFATVLLISGCRDDQLSLDGFSNGLFTENLRAVWNEGNWQGGYSQFHEAILARMPAKQQPQYTRVGAPDPEFEQATPFTIG